MRGQADRAERGAVLTTVALSMVALVAGGALAVDLGMALVERREARNAADHAALAAAWADCNGDSAEDAADASANRNGYDAATELTLTEVDTGTYHAQIDTEIDTHFAGVIGFNTVDVSGEATAQCSGGGGGGSANAIFAFGDTCLIEPIGKRQIDMSGSNNEVYGGIHSNTNIWVGGSNNDLGWGNGDPDPGDPPIDRVTYVTEYGDMASLGDQDFDPGFPAQAGFEDPPDFINIDDYRPGGAAAVAAAGDGKYFSFTGKITSGDINSDGLYYTTDEVDLADSNENWNITVVAEKTIKVGGSNTEYHPYVDGIFLIGAIPYAGLDQCDKFTVAMSGSSNSWSGIVYSPFGVIEFDGSDNTALTGSLLGYAVRINGSNIRINANPDLFPDSGGGAPLLLN